MIRDRSELDKAGTAELIRVREVADADLDVDAVLRSQARHGGRADVIDAQRTLAEHGADAPRDVRKLAGPPVGVGNYLDARHVRRRLARHSAIHASPRRPSQSGVRMT